MVERWLVPDPAGSVGINHGWARSQTSLMASIYCRRHNISSWVVRRNIILNKSSLITPFPERFPLQLNQRWTGTLNKSTVDRGVCERDERESVFVWMWHRARDRWTSMLHNPQLSCYRSQKCWRGTWVCVVLAFPRPSRLNRWDLRGWSKACGAAPGHAG